jgi:DNA-binding IclR family transcriptional regulator
VLWLTIAKIVFCIGKGPMAGSKKLSSDASIKSAERVLAVLEYFRERKCAATVGEIAGTLRLPQSSTTMLLKCLQKLGYLDYFPQSRVFRPTYRVAVLGNWIQQSLFESGPLTATMDSIGYETGETVVLGRQHAAQMQYIHIVPATQVVQMSIQVGILRPMVRTALGCMLLSRKTDDEIRAIVRRNNADEPSKEHRVEERKFIMEIEAIRAQGYAESRGRMTAGASIIAMLVPAENNLGSLAIGVGGPIERMDERRMEIVETMRRHLRAK